MQLLKHNLVLKEKELQKHYRLTTFAKVYKKSQRYTCVHCPHCDTARAITKNQEIVNCKNCASTFVASHDDKTTEVTTFFALRSLGSDDKGYNEGVARCPQCGIYISKGDGCSHMVCGACRCDFFWHKARRVDFSHLKVAKTTNNPNHVMNS